VTPLAQRLVRQLTLPVKDRTFENMDFVRFISTDLHCFEVTAIQDHAIDLGNNLGIQYRAGNRTLPPTVFLPAEKTWYEFVCDGTRFGYLAVGDEKLINLTEVLYRPEAGARLVCHMDINLVDQTMTWRMISDGADKLIRKVYEGTYNGDTIVGYVNVNFVMFFGFMCMINQPRSINRTTHQPHAGFQRNLAHSMGMVGRFPLHAWTELFLDTGKLETGKTGDHDAYLSGRKCLHWCRSHLRFYDEGKWTVIKEHWRGDPSIGIKQSRYIVK